MPFHPWDRTVELHDDRGRVFALGAMSGTPLTKTLIPAEAHTTQLTFDAPRDATGLRLLVTTPDPVSWFLIGDENTPGMARRILGFSTSADSASLARKRNKIPVDSRVARD